MVEFEKRNHGELDPKEKKRLQELIQTFKDSEEGSEHLSKVNPKEVNDAILEFFEKVDRDLSKLLKNENWWNLFFPDKETQEKIEAMSESELEDFKIHYLKLGEELSSLSYDRSFGTDHNMVAALANKLQPVLGAYDLVLFNKKKKKNE